MSAPAENARSPAPRMISALASRTCALASVAASSLLERGRERVQLVGAVERHERDRAVALAQDQAHAISPLVGLAAQGGRRHLGDPLVERVVGLLRVPRRVRREHEVGRVEAVVVGQRRLVVPDVHERPRRPLLGEAVDQRLDVDQLGARGVDEDRAGLQSANSSRAEQRLASRARRARGA